MHMHSLDSPTVSHNVLLPAGPWPSCAWQLLRFSPFPVGHPMSAGCNVTPHRRIASIHPFPPCVPPINTRVMAFASVQTDVRGVNHRWPRSLPPRRQRLFFGPPLRLFPSHFTVRLYPVRLASKKSPSANATSVEFLEIVDWGVELFRVW